MARAAGIPNKNKAFLLNRLQDMYGKDFHPIMTMAKNAVEFQRMVDAKEVEDKGQALVDANKLWDGIAQYVEPKLKAIDLDLGVQENNPLSDLIKQISGKVLEPK